MLFNIVFHYFNQTWFQLISPKRAIIEVNNNCIYFIFSDLSQIKILRGFEIYVIIRFSLWWWNGLSQNSPTLTKYLNLSTNLNRHAHSSAQWGHESS